MRELLSVNGIVILVFYCLFLLIRYSNSSKVVEEIAVFLEDYNHQVNRHLTKAKTLISTEESVNWEDIAIIEEILGKAATIQEEYFFYTDKFCEWNFLKHLVIDVNVWTADSIIESWKEEFKEKVG